MTALPPFLAALELDAEADERAVRRAYAKRVRLIDQEADPAAFQALREHFEDALRWVAWRAQQSAPAGTPDVAPPPSESAPSPAPSPAEPATAAAAPALPPAEAIGDAVFVQFAHAVAADITSEAAAAQALQRALADERLVNVDARAFFEWRCATLLLEGWQPGHEWLFPAATTAFHWDSDRRRLALFGQAGMAIDQAVGERLIFMRLPEADRGRLLALIVRLRTEPPRDAADLHAHIPAVIMLLQRHGNFMRVATARAVMSAWIEQWKAIPEAQREAIMNPPPVRVAPPALQPAVQPAATASMAQHRSVAPPRSGGAGMAALWVGAILVVVFAINHVTSRPRPFAAPATSRPAWLEPSKPAVDLPDLQRRQRLAQQALDEAQRESARP